MELPNVAHSPAANSSPLYMPQFQLQFSKLEALNSELNRTVSTMFDSFGKHLASESAVPLLVGC